MPRFFFHVHDGRAVLDEEGTELPDFDQARREAIRLAGQILDNEAPNLELAEDWHMDVTDESGLILFRLDFTLTASAAVGRSRKRP